MSRVKQRFGRYVHVEYDDGPIIRLQLKCKKNAQEAMGQLLAFYRLILSHWGSREIGSGLRFRYQHSSPGATPFRQTGNLRESLKVSVADERTGRIRGFLGRFLPAKTMAHVQTDVPYAPILEQGGMSLIDPPTPYTNWKLKNPIPKTVMIQARPVFKKGFEVMMPKIMNTLKRGF